MKKVFYLILFALFLFTPHLFAQPGGPARLGKMPAIGRLYGKVFDANTKEPAAFATVVLLAMQKDSTISGCLVKENGDFSMENLPFGQYRLQVGFIGYQKHEQKVNLSMQNVEQDLGNILLQPDTKVLKEVEVTGEKSTFQMNIDRKVYNVDKDISARGGTGLDAVKNIPGVTVDADGGVSMRNSNVQVYIDGRPSTLSLQQIPADQIEKVEVITNPSAKFDASTTGGILNVIQKKNTKPGYNGMVMGGLGTGNRKNAMLNLNVKEGKFNFFSMFNYNTQTNKNDGFTRRTNLIVTPPDPGSGLVNKYFNQTDTNTMTNTFINGRLGFDYQIDNRNTLTLSGNVVKGEFKVHDLQQYSSSDVNHQFISTGSRLNERLSQFTNLTGQMQYKRTYPKKDKELTSDITFNRNEAGTNYLFTTYGYDNLGNLKANSPSYQKNNGITPSWMITYQTDYVNPINDSTKLETGIKLFYNRSTTQSQTYNYSYAVSDYIVYPDLTNDYTITNMTNAAYITYSSKLRKNIGYQAGLRFEQTDYSGVITNKNLSFSYSYPNSLKTLQYAFFPSIYLTKKLPKDQEVQLNFSRKINRPHFFQTIPFVVYADNMNMTIGNPALAPEFHNLAELNYNAVKNKTNLLVSLYGKYTQNPITNISYPLEANPNILVSTFQNGQSSFSYGTDNSLKFTLFSKMDFTLSSNIFYTTINWSDGGKQYTNHGYSSVEKAMISYKFPANFTLQVNGNYKAPQILPQGYNRETKFMDISLSKSIMKFITATIQVSDVFNSKRHGIDFITPDYIQNLSRRRETRFVKFTLSVMFGKADASLFKRAKQQRSNQASPDMDF